MPSAIANHRPATATEERSVGASSWVVAPGVWRLKDLFVNVYIVENSQNNDWFLVDTGLKSTAARLHTLVEELFGSRGSRPKAILLTHGHFDHVGSVRTLAQEWGVPVYAHTLEMPYLTGKASYPPTDPAVGGGMMSLSSVIYPKKPIDISDLLIALPENGSIPGFSEWKWIHTPGHTAGHVSLFRERDGVLIAGDSIVTTMTESLVSTITQKKFIQGPPKYFTPDWGAATRSARALSELEPAVIATGHGQSMYGLDARKELHKLVREFWKWGIPATGRYVKEAVQYDETGAPSHIPSPKGVMLKRMAVAAGMFALGYIIYSQRKNTSGVEKMITEKLGKNLMGSSYAALGATAPAAALPALPLIPAL